MQEASQVDSHELVLWFARVVTVRFWIVGFGRSRY